MNAVSWVERAATACARVGLVLASVAMISMLLLIVLEIVLREVFGSTTLVSTEMSGYLLVGCTFLGLADTFLANGFIRVDIVYARLSPPLRDWLDLCIGAASTFATLIITGYSWAFVANRFETGETSVSITRTPLWIPQLVIPIGATLLTLALIAATCRSLQALRKGAGAPAPASPSLQNNPAEWL